MAERFIVRTSIGAATIQSLVDTGANLTFISAAATAMLLKTNSVKLQKCDSLKIRLANNSFAAVDKCISTMLAIQGRMTKILAYVMPLPPGIDVILGLDWMAETDCWLHPAKKSIMFLKPKETREVVACATGGPR